MKKIKQQATILAICVIVLGSIQYADAEMLIIEGQNDEAYIVVAIQDDLNIIHFYDPIGYSSHIDSEIKHYQSGISIENPESGIFIFLKEIDETQYKIVVLTSEGIQIINGNVISTIESKETTR